MLSDPIDESQTEKVTPSMQFLALLEDSFSFPSTSVSLVTTEIALNFHWAA